MTLDTRLIAHAYCFECGCQRSWTWDGGQNTATPQADFWRCRTCGYRRLHLGNVLDCFALCRNVLETRLRGLPKRPDFDYDDALGHLQAEVWAVYLSWEPTLCASFLAYATWKLQKALSDWYERWLGRDDPENRHYLKVTAFSVSLDAILPSGDSHEGSELASPLRSRLGSALGQGEGDPGAGRGVGLQRAIEQGNRVEARGEGVLGLAAARRAKAGNQGAGP